MPRIDPLQLLTCLSVLLAPNGGIKSYLEVRRIASLMGKFSKKLVSKCIYIQILKCSETELLGQFMETGGWMLTHSWLQDAITTKNWPLVQEILELFLLCPVDVDRLKSNSAPKMVKSLSKEGSHEGVRILASKLVEQWLKVVKGETVVIPSNLSVISPGNPLSGLVGRSSTQQMLIDPSNSAYVDNLAMDVELNGIGESGGPGVEVDDITPTLNHDGLMEMDTHLLAAEDHGSEAMILDSGDGLFTMSNGDIFNGETVENKGEGERKETLKFKCTLKDGKRSLAKVDSVNEKKKPEEVENKEKKDREKDKERSEKSSKDRKSSSSHHKSSSSSSKSSSSHHSSKSSSSSSHRSSSKSSSRDKDKDKDRHRSSSSKSSSSSSSSRDKDKHRSSSSSSSKENKEKVSTSQAEKDKDTLSKVMGPASIDKLGKIPKKPKTDDPSKQSTDGTNAGDKAPPVKKPSISIEVRKDMDNRPKTVKTFNSQFRNHGLVEEAPPPPSRKTLKKPTSTPSGPVTGSPLASVTTPSQIKSSPSTAPTLKRSSPPPMKESPTEKKLKLDIFSGVGSEEKQEKPGGIKLIAPRSKPATLIESDMFMDALCSTATTHKKDTKKKKRRTSTSKEGDPETPTPESPKMAAAPLKFYQDTLEESEEKADKSAQDDDSKRDDEDNREEETEENSVEEKTDEKMDVDEENSESKTEEPEPEEEEEDPTPRIKVPGPGCGPDGPPGVLVIHRRKGPKKSVRWRNQEHLEEVRFFELDETERVNVTKTFTDMKQMERFGERDCFIMARKLQNEDVMMEQTQWMALIELDDVPPYPEVKSKEKQVQLEREQSVLQALYFSFAMIPDSPSEPDLEQYKHSDPVLIPLEDGQNSVNDFTKQGWPDAKESPPHSNPGGGFNGVMFGNEPNPGFSQFMPFGGNAPGGGGPGMPPNAWQMGQAPFPGPNNQMPPFNNPMNPEEMKMMQFNNFGGQNFMPPNFNGMNPMNMPGMGPPGLRGGPNWGFRPNHPGGPPWRAPPHGGPPMMMGPRREWVNNNQGGGGARMCKLFKKGFCKKGDKCNFMHPGFNNRI